MRPFAGAARVSCRGYSLGLERVVTDFGADVSLARVPEKVREHYGIEVCASTVRAITEGHGAALESASEVSVRLPLRWSHKACHRDGREYGADSANG